MKEKNASTNCCLNCLYHFSFARRDLQMPKKGSRKKSRVSDADLDMEVILDTRKETMFEVTKSVTGIAPEFKWVELYRII